MAKQSAAKRWKERLLLSKVEPSRKIGQDVCALLGARESLAGMQFFKLNVQNWVFAPVFVIEVPPFVLVDGEALGFHGTAKQVAMPALERSAARIVGEGARRHFIISAGHFDGLAGSEIVECEIDGAAAIVARAFGGIGDEDLAFGGSGVPEDLGDVPGAIGVVYEQAVAEGLEFREGANESFSGGAL